MGDYRVGLIGNPTVSLAVAVAASSAFPPVLSPVTLELAPTDFDQTEGADLTDDAYRTEAVLTDGGVYDNLGLETAFKRYQTILVSDAGQKISPEADPKHDWARHALRVNEIIDNQVRSLRKRQLIEAYQRTDIFRRSGAYWGIRSHVADYRGADPLKCERADTMELATLKTRLKQLNAPTQERLINWGYAICDAALRAHFGPELQSQYEVRLEPPSSVPYPAAWP